MDLDELYQRLSGIFCEVFDLDEVDLSPELVADDVEGWDSLGHIRLIVTIEQAFGFQFSTSEIGDLPNLGKFVAVIKRKLDEDSE